MCERREGLHSLAAIHHQSPIFRVLSNKAKREAVSIIFRGNSNYSTGQWSQTFAAEGGSSVARSGTSTALGTT
jgi:hypothetical protein